MSIGNIPADRLLIGLGALLLGLLVTFGLPVSPRRVNQTIPTILAIVLFFTSAIALLDWPTWLIAGGGSYNSSDPLSGHRPFYQACLLRRHKVFTPRLLVSSRRGSNHRQ